jgi:hypothetical protein
MIGHRALRSRATIWASAREAVPADALGYSYADDPDLMHCSEGLGSESSDQSLWLGSCGLSGGASGGAWLQPGDRSGSARSSR